MRSVIQRVSEASVSVEGAVVGRIGRGLLALVGVHKADTADDAEWMARKIAELRIFPDTEGKMNLSVADVAGGVLVVSQFTLLGELSKGRRPNFMDAAAPDLARALVESVVERLRAYPLKVETGSFGALMRVALVNDGPVTIILESPSARGACARSASARSDRGTEP
jgi:D-tyrosyl-tRNA(Tyr) deacylase